MPDTFTARDSLQPPPAEARLGRPRRHYADDLVAVAYIGAIGLIALLSGAIYILFPELGALSWDVMRRPHGRWGSAPLMLALTPALTGAVGTVATRNLPYGFASVAIVVCASILILRTMQSPIAPAISAGLLPLVLGVTSWWYPPGILLGSTLLAALLLGWRRSSPLVVATSRAATPPGPAVEPEPHPEPLLALDWLAPLLIFVLIAVAMVKLTDMRFILFPPLVVLLYEMFHDPYRCPWAPHLGRLPVVCFAAALGGFMVHQQIPLIPLAAALSMAWGVIVLRIFRTNVPPALAVALLPMVIDRPTILYPISVGIGIALGALWFAIFRRFRARFRMVGVSS
jgi:hypothetical protein